MARDQVERWFEGQGQVKAYGQGLPTICQGRFGAAVAGSYRQRSLCDLRMWSCSASGCLLLIAWGGRSIGSGPRCSAETAGIVQRAGAEHCDEDAQQSVTDRA
jgi:hypothetical protein